MNYPQELFEGTFLEKVFQIKENEYVNLFNRTVKSIDTVIGELTDLEKKMFSFLHYQSGKYRRGKLNQMEIEQGEIFGNLMFNMIRNRFPDHPNIGIKKDFKIVSLPPKNLLSLDLFYIKNFLDYWLKNN